MENLSQCMVDPFFKQFLFRLQRNIFPQTQIKLSIQIQLPDNISEFRTVSFRVALFSSSLSLSPLYSNLILWLRISLEQHNFQDTYQLNENGLFDYPTTSLLV